MNCASGTWVFGRLELQLDQRRLCVDGRPVALGSRAFDLLRALVAQRERVLSKDELLDTVWPGLVVEENNLQVQISALRRVLGAQAIATVAGVGYRFTLDPGPAAQRPAVYEPATPATASTPRARVLVADDNKVNRLLLCRSLELMGHSVSCAENGRQALELLRAQPFDLLMLDLTMPELDGYALLERRAADASLHEVAVIVTSALGGVAPVARCIELGAEDFLHKPVDPWLLKARVDSSLARKRQYDLQGETLRRLLPTLPSRAGLMEDTCVLAGRLGGVEALVDALAPAQTLDFLSHWCTLMLDGLAEHGGEPVQLGGERVMALFASAAAAVAAAQDLLALWAQFQTEQPQATALRLGLGLARGRVLLGTLSTGRRLAPACVGDAVLRAEALALTALNQSPAIEMDEAARQPPNRLPGP